MKKTIFALSVLVAATAFATDRIDFAADGSELRPLLHSTCFNANVKDHNAGQEPYLTNGGFASSETILWSEGDFNQRVTDIHHIFPLVGQDPTDAANYFFAASDRKMFYAARCGLDVMYRLGSSKERAGHNAHTLVPTNFANTAEVMSRIISHYKGGFANGVDYSSRITRWEIWSGPDDPDCWWAPDRTPAELKAAFAEFFVTCLRKIKTDHPEVKVGGPALSKWDPDYMDAILDACDAAGVYPDFISYQCYTNSVDGLLSQPAEIRSWLDARGANYADCEIVLSAWHYLPDAAGSGTLADLDMDKVHRASFGEGGTMTATAAAFNLAVLSGLQDTPLARAYHGASTAFGAFSPFHWSTYNTSVPHVAANAFKMFGTVTKGYTRVLSVQNDGARSVIAVANDAGTKGALLVTDSSGAAGSIEVPFDGLESVSGLASKVVNDSGSDVQTLSSGVTLAATGVTIAKAAGPQSYLLTFDMTAADEPVDPDDPTGKTYVFVGGDVSGTSSFVGSTAGAATGWALQSAPGTVVGLSSLSSEDTFIVSDPDAMNKTLRAPGSGNPTFPGGTLRLDGGWLALPGNAQTVTVGDLVADGGGVVHYSSGATMTLAGNVAVSNGGFKVYVNAGGNSRNLIVSSKVTGDGPISFLGSTSSDSLAEFIEFSGDMGGWTGTVTDDPSLSSHMKQLTLRFTGEFGGTVSALPAGTAAVKFNYDGLPDGKGVVVATTTVPTALKTKLTLFGSDADFSAADLPLITFPAGTTVVPTEFTVRYASSVDGAATAFANLGTVENADGTITLVANVSSGKTMIVDSMVTLSKTFRRVGEPDYAALPTVTVNDGTRDLVLDTDYTMSWSPAAVSGEGTYTVTVAGIGDYEGSATATYTVQSAWTPPTGATFYEKLANDTRAVASSDAATGGDYIYRVSDTEFIHVFKNSGTFTPNQDLANVQVLVVGGGGSGGSASGGGGGAGGLVCRTGVSLASSTGYVVAVGAGGAKNTVSRGNGYPGGASSIGDITAPGGGGGAGMNLAGVAGGSGGGGSGDGKSGGAGTADLGYAGGAGGVATGGYAIGGGGGGAGQLGWASGTVGPTQTESAFNAGCGGDGLEIGSQILGYEQYFAGGGGGGTAGGQTRAGAGGLGGGGRGGYDVNNVTYQTSGENGLGGGGGGGAIDWGGKDQNGAAGGKGIVIVRYSTTGVLSKTIVDSMVTLSKTAATTDDADYATLPTVTVTDGAEVLEPGVDYTLSWSPAAVTGVGVYTATVTGIGEYHGVVTKTYDVSLANAYYLVGQDADKTSSFVKSSTSAIGWSETEGGTVLADHLVTAGNNYIVPGGTTLRTPYDTPNDDPTNVFNGASLTLAGELNLRAASGSGRRIITIENLIADGGTVNTKSTSNHPLGLDGSIAVPEGESITFDLTGASGSTHFHDLLVTSTISGDGTIKVGLGTSDTSGKTSIIDFAGDMSGFTGEIDRLNANKVNSFTFVLSSSSFGGSIKNLPDRNNDPSFVFNWAGLPAGKGVVISGEGLPPCMRYRSIFYNFPSLDTKNIALFTFLRAKGEKAAGGTFDNTSINFTNCVSYLQSGDKATAISKIQSSSGTKLNTITCVEYADGSCTWFYNYDPSGLFAVVPAGATALTSEEIAAVNDGTYSGAYYADGVHYYRFNGWEEILEAIGIDPATGASAVAGSEWLGGSSASAMLNVTVANVTNTPSEFVSRTGDFGNGVSGLQLIRSADKIQYTQFNLIGCDFPPDEDGATDRFWGTQVNEQEGLRFVFDDCVFGSTDGARPPTFTACTTDGSKQTVDFEFYDCEINRGVDGADGFLYSTDDSGVPKNPGVGDLVLSNCTLDAFVMARSTGKDAFGGDATLMMEDCTLSDRVAVPGRAFAYAQAGFTSGTYRDFKYADGSEVAFFVLESASDDDPGVLLLKGDTLLEGGAAQTDYDYTFNASDKIFFYAVAPGRVTYLDDGAQVGTVPVDPNVYGLETVAQTVTVLDGTLLVKSGRPFTGWHKRVYDEKTGAWDDSDETVYETGNTIAHVFMQVVDEGDGNSCLYARQLYFVPVWGEQIAGKFYYTRAVTNSVENSDDIVLVYTNTAVSGTLEVPYGYTARILVIGGGGAGSSGMGGSGGSSGEVVERELTLTAGRYMITVGKGGKGTSLGAGTDGGTTTFRRQDGTGETITAGGGKGSDKITGSYGGNGGYGYAGNGAEHSGYNGGDGGDGYVSDITGTASGYAAGGGGSTTDYTPGRGGTVTIDGAAVEVGGGGGYTAGGVHSGVTPRIGSGAGGGGGPGNAASGGDGGSGIVVVRLIGGAEVISKELKDPAGHDYYYDTREHVGVEYVMNPLGLPDAAENAWWGFLASEPQDVTIPLDGVVKATDVGNYSAYATPDAANGFVWELPLHELGAATAIDGTTTTTKTVPWRIFGGTPGEFPESIGLRVTCEQTAGAPAKFPIVVTTNWLARAFPAACPNGIVVNEAGKSAVEALLDEPDTGNGLRRAWQNYVLGGFVPGDPAGRVWIRADQTGDAATLRVRVQDFVPVADSGFTVNYRLNSKADDAADYTPGAAGASAVFDAALPSSEARYFIDTIFIPAGYDASCECVPTVNTAGVRKVESSKRREIVSSPWSGFSPSEVIGVSAEDFVKAACLSVNDVLYVYDRENSNYLAWSVQENGTWKPVETYLLVDGVATRSSTDAPRTNSIPRGAGVWLDRGDATKPIYLYGQVDESLVTTQLAPGFNLVGNPFAASFDAGTLEAPAKTGLEGDRIAIPTGGAPINCTYESGKGWGWETNVVVEVELPDGSKISGVNPTWSTEGLTLPAGHGFWYYNSGSECVEFTWPSPQN